MDLCSKAWFEINFNICGNVKVVFFVIFLNGRLYFETQK